VQEVGSQQLWQAGTADRSPQEPPPLSPQTQALSARSRIAATVAGWNRRPKSAGTAAPVAAESAPATATATVAAPNVSQRHIPLHCAVCHMGPPHERPTPVATAALGCTLCPLPPERSTAVATAALRCTPHRCTAHVATAARCHNSPASARAPVPVERAASALVPVAVERVAFAQRRRPPVMLCA